MIDGKVLKGEGNMATVTESLLLAEEGMLMSLIAGQLANVCTFGNVFAVDKVIE
jgi:hypothetical protein